LIIYIDFYKDDYIMKEKIDFLSFSVLIISLSMSFILLITFYGLILDGNYYFYEYNKIIAIIEFLFILINIILIIILLKRKILEIK